MFGLNPYALLAALVGSLALFGAGAWTGHKVTSNAWVADMAATREADRVAYEQKLAQANARADELEKANVAIRANTRVVTRTVNKLVERPVYRNVCLDADGLRAVSDALGLSAPDAASPPTALPGSPAPRGRDGSLDPAHAH